jgi:putative transcriptional regulator
LEAEGLLANLPVFFGGPVQTDRGFVLHRPVGALAIDAGGQPSSVGLTSSRDVLQAVAREGEPHEIMVTLGYSGWGAGQLEHELAQNAWLTVPAKPFILFESALRRTTRRRRWSCLASISPISPMQAGHA